MHTHIICYAFTVNSYVTKGIFKILSASALAYLKVQKDLECIKKFKRGITELSNTKTELHNLTYNPLH